MPSEPSGVELEGLELARAALAALPREAVTSAEDLRQLRRRLFDEAGEIAPGRSATVERHAAQVERILRDKWPEYTAAVSPEGGWVVTKGPPT